MKYERIHDRLLTRREFVMRYIAHAGVSAIAIGASLIVGTVGFHYRAHFSWTDAFLNASMLLGGMGPVGTFDGDHGKIFASLYALYAGLVFIVVASLMFAPVFHRVLHRFHLEE